MRPSLWEADRDGEWSGRLRPHSTSQQTWFSLIHLLIYSFIQIVFVEHLPCVRSQGSEVGKSQALLSGCSRSGGGDSISVTCTVMGEASVSWSWRGWSEEASDSQAETRRTFGEQVS